MEFSEYQKIVYSVNVYGVIYPTIGLCDEAGKVAEKIKEVLSDNAGEFTEERKQEIKNGLGDVFWYLAAIANNLGLDLDDVIQTNVKKVHFRRERN